MSRFRDSLERIKNTCSLLVVCVMAHGRQGMVIDSYNTHSEINGFFTAVEDIMPAAIPVVGNKKL